MKTQYERYDYREGGLSVWTPVDNSEIKKGDVFKILVDDVPIIKESGSFAFIAATDAYFDIIDKQYRVPVQD